MEQAVIEFDQMVAIGCGLDVHKANVVATVGGVGIKEQTRTFDTLTGSLEQLRLWLLEVGATHVAMESTSVYWKPVFNILEQDFEILLVNASHVKNVPGRKTDKADSRWLTKLLLSGLLKGSFIPPRDIRELRDLVRYKKKLITQIAAEKNRFQKILEDANIKIGDYISDVFGVSGTAITNAIINGETDPAQLVKLADGRLRAPKEKLAAALTAKTTPHHRFMLKAIRKSIQQIQALVSELEAEIDNHLSLYQSQLDLLETIPGIAHDGAGVIISEIGTDMSAFPSAQHLASWAGVSPGNNESAGKKKVDE